MDRRRSLALLLVVGCAAGSLENNSFGLPASATQPDPTAADGDASEDSTGTTTGDDPSGQSGSAEEETTAPPTTAAESSTDPTEATDPTDEPTTDPTDPTDDPTDPTDAESTGPVDPSTDDGVDPPPPPPMVGEWENCAEAVCDAGNDCIGVVGLDNNDAYCAPQCLSDLDCPLPDSGTAEPYCLLVAEDEVDPTNCALVCEYDGFDFGTCPNGMQCAAIPDQAPTISLCMW